MQVAHAIAGQTCLGFGALAGSALVTQFATAASCGARERGNRGRMVMCFDLDNWVDQLVLLLVSILVRCKRLTHASLNNGCIIFVSQYGAVGCARVGVANHAEQSVFTLRAVDFPVCIENFVPAVLRVGLRVNTLCSA